jgi:hypothetical protein
MRQLQTYTCKVVVDNIEQVLNVQASSETQAQRAFESYVKSRSK